MNRLLEPWLGPASIMCPDDAELLSKLDTFLQTLSPSDQDEEAVESTVKGRVGPDNTRIHKAYSYGTFGLEVDETRVVSRSNFASVRADTAVFEGRWQYEVTLITGGLMQIGWSALSSAFSETNGVGDGDLSYAYDGSRQKTWPESDYGSDWAEGDVIGCEIDFTAGSLTFYRNGISQGVAFEDIHRPNGAAYFPSASLSLGESALFNFGRSSFVYPISECLPIAIAYENRCEILMQMIRAVAVSTHDYDISPSQSSLLFAAIWNRLGPILGSDPVAVKCILAPHLAPMHRASCLSILFSSLYNSVSHSLASYIILNVLQSVTNLDLIVALLEVSVVMECFQAAAPSLYGTIESWFTSNSASGSDLNQWLPTAAMPWLPGSIFEALPTFQIDLQNSTAEIEALHTVSATREAQMHRLARTLGDIFAPFALDIVERNLNFSHHPPLPGQTNATVFLNVFFCILRILSDSGRLDDAETVPLRTAIKCEAGKRELTRLGGLLSFLRKEHPLDDEILTQPEAGDSVEAVLIDAMLMCFHLVLNAKYRKAQVNISRWEDVHARRPVPGSAEYDKLVTGLKVCVWNSIFLFSPLKQHLLCKTLGFVVSLMQRVSTDAPMAFGYFPQYYLEFLLDSFRPLFSCSLPCFDFSETPQRRQVLSNVISFLVDHINDPRVANPEIRDVMMQQLNQLLSSSRGASIADQTLGIPEKLLKSLMSNANRNWVLVSAVLLRFFQGSRVWQR